MMKDKSSTAAPPICGALSVTSSHGDAGSANVQATYAKPASAITPPAFPHENFGGLPGLPSAFHLSAARLFSSKPLRITKVGTPIAPTTKTAHLPPDLSGVNIPRSET